MLAKVVGTQVAGTGVSVMIWTQFDELPQLSVAVHVRVMTCPVGQVPVTTFVEWASMLLQLSIAIANPTRGLNGVVFDPHGRVTSAGHDVMRGGVVSLIVIVCAQVFVFPHASVA